MPDDEFPQALAEIAEIDFPYEADNSIDYEPYSEFMSPADTTHLWRAWTGNTEVDGDAFRIFAQDGSGGAVAFWKYRQGLPLVDQPVVFLGSEGELGAVASNLADFLWLLAQGTGPYELVSYGGGVGQPMPEVELIAQQWAPGTKRAPEEIAADVADITAALESYVKAASA